MSKNDINAVKNYWDSRPCNLRHSKSEVGTIKYFNEVEQRKYFVEPHIPNFADFPKWKGKKVLEIGCGIGTDAVNFARNGAIYTGIELSEESLNLAKKRFDLFDLKGNFYLSNAENLSEIIHNETFDLVYSFGVIHHTPMPEKIINNIKKILSPEAEFRLMLYAKNSWKNIMIENEFDQPEAQSGCPIALTYSEEEIFKLLDGFNIVDLRQDHIFPYIIEKYKNYEYELQPWFKSMPIEMFRALETSLGWHYLIKCQLPKNY
jgi:ubiquinone/menaquinone biosynthesis C-methylase UbiE